LRFGDINAAYLLWGVLLAALFYIWAFNKRRETLERFAQKELLKDIAASASEKRRKYKIFLIIAALFFSVITLMRPQLGFKWQEVKRVGLDILIAIDTSKSMLARDVKPNRLERSKLAVKDLVKKLKGDRIGLIAFSGKAFLQCPLTADYNGFILSLDGLSVDSIPRGGTSISSAIKEAIGVFRNEPQNYRVLVIITDGEDHEGDLLRAAQEADREKIKIFCIGIGTTEGELIPVTDERDRQVFLKDPEGNIVKTRLDEDALQKIAYATGGSYIHATGAEFGLDLLYKEKLSKMEKRSFESKMVKQYEERFQIPLALAILFLVIEAFIGERKPER